MIIKNEGLTIGECDKIFNHRIHILEKRKQYIEVYFEVLVLPEVMKEEGFWTYSAVHHLEAIAIYWPHTVPD